MPVEQLAGRKKFGCRWLHGRKVYEGVVDSIIGRWMRLKVVMNNINNGSSVKLESYLDNKNTNYWVKVTDLVDDCGRYAKTSASGFRLAGCNRDKDYVVVNEGSVTTFRSDNLIWDFKDLSIREVDPHQTRTRME